MELMNRMITAQFEAQESAWYSQSYSRISRGNSAGLFGTLHSSEIQLNMAVPFDFVKQTAEFVKEGFSRNVNPAD